MTTIDRNFASDNVAGVAEPVMAALLRANEGSAASYGEDAWSARLGERMSAVFERRVAVFPVATGTAANALALATLCPPYGAAYCEAQSHVARDECGAPEFYGGGLKLLGLPSTDGRLRPEQLVHPLAMAQAFGVHHVKPAALSVANATEWGTVYDPDALAALARTAREAGLRVHVDGARFANAVASLGCAPAELTWRAGVDVLSFGATKNGALACEAVVVFDEALAESVAYRRMRGGHLWSKSRFLAAQWLGYLGDGAWLGLARHANAMAARLSAGLAQLPGVRLVQPTQVNEVFVELPEALHARLVAAGFAYHRWPLAEPERAPVYRFVCSFRTAAESVDALLAAARG